GVVVPFVVKEDLVEHPGCCSSLRVKEDQLSWVFRVWDSEPQPVGLFHRPEQASLLGQGGCRRPWSLRCLHLRRQIEVKRRYPSEKKELDRRNKNPPQAPPARTPDRSQKSLLMVAIRQWDTKGRAN
ncbi:hypothetical protein Taro_022555, partial [Colocasia esculenta]|nr:hypothetical protein [Colocasia esculenta]